MPGILFVTLWWKVSSSLISLGLDAGTFWVCHLLLLFLHHLYYLGIPTIPWYQFACLVPNTIHAFMSDVDGHQALQHFEGFHFGQNPTLVPPCLPSCMFSLTLIKRLALAAVSNSNLLPVFRPLDHDLMSHPAPWLHLPTTKTSPYPSTSVHQKAVFFSQLSFNNWEAKAKCFLTPYSICFN